MRKRAHYFRVSEALHLKPFMVYSVTIVILLIFRKANYLSKFSYIQKNLATKQSIFYQSFLKNH